MSKERKEGQATRPVARDAMIPSGFRLPDRQQIVSDSEQLFLGRLFQAGSCAQAELTEQLDLSQQSISRMAAALGGRGLIVRGALRANGQRGQPSPLLRLNPDYACTFGISLLADGIAVNLTDFTGQTRGYRALKLETLSRERVFEGARATMAELLETAGLNPQRVFGLGVAVTGFRIGGTAAFNTPDTLDEFALVDLVDLFSHAFGLPVWVDNDGNAAAVGENLTGVGRRTRDLAYLYIATGLGGGIIQDGRLSPGRRGNAGEFSAILPIDLFERRPTLELLRRRVNGHGLAIETVAELVEKYDDAWPGIDEWIAEVTPALSLIVSATAAILDTDYIVLGGLLPRSLAERLIPQVEFFDIQRRSVSRQTARLVPAECRGDAAAIGASLLPLIDKFFTT